MTNPQTSCPTTAFLVVQDSIQAPTLYLVIILFWASLVAQLVKNLPAMWETWVQSLGWEDPLEKKMAAHSSILAWRISWTTLWGQKESDMAE